jgi:uncharacterized protein (TIGR02271 family)
MQNEKDLNKNRGQDANRDPIAGTAGSPGVGGGLAGKRTAEAMNPAREEAYWRQQHAKEAFGQERPYEQYQGAYRTGYEGFSKYGNKRTFEECEPDLQREYEQNRGQSNIGWDEARHATRAAWEKVQGRWDRLIDYDVQDQNNNKIGTVQNVWTDQSNQPRFLGVKTGWIFGKNHVVPVHTSTMNDNQRTIRVPFTEDKVKEAPTFDPDYDLSDADEERIYMYYGLQRPREGMVETGTAQQQRPMPAERTAQPQATGQQQQANIKLAEEQLKVGKREVVVGGVRLRKIIRTEIVNQPVELKREEIVIERVPVGAQAAGQATFEEQDVFIPLRREEPVIQKEARVREEVRVRKESKTEEQTVSGQVRKEDVEVQKEGEEPRFATEPGAKRDQPGRYEPKERGRRP